MSGRRIKVFPGALFVAVGIAAIVIAVISALRIQQFVRVASSAPGRVYRLESGGSHPEIEFTTEAGNKITFPQGGWIFGYKVGDPVRVLYRASDPGQSARLDAVGALWEPAGFPALMGLLFLGGGIMALFRREDEDVREEHAA